MSKNAFTPDGGPHRPDRVRNVSDGLKRLGEFEAAEMLANYAALLREREGRNTWEQTAKLIGDDIDSTESLIEAGREAAKAGVTDEMGIVALAAYDAYKNPRGGPAMGIDKMHAALEAVAPMLASARVPEGAKNLLLEAYDFGQFSSDFNYPQAISVRRAICEICDWLAAAPKPETEG